MITIVTCNDRSERREQISWVTYTLRLDGGHDRDDTRSPMRGAVLPGGRVQRGVLLASTLHLPPSAVPFVSDVRFRRSPQRLVRLT